MDRLKTISLGMVRRYGVSLTFSRTSGSVYDPATGALTGGSATVYKVKALLQDYSPALIAQSSGLIGIGDRRATVADDNYIPRPGDRVSVEGVAYHVLEVIDHSLAETWEAHLKPV